MSAFPGVTELSPRGDGAILNYDDLVQADRVHGSLYTSDAVYREELEQIFYKGWVYVGHESEIPKPGDFVRRNIGEEPVVLLRDRKGALQVVKNRCAHRGNLIVTKERGNAKNFACTYHGWVFNLNGQLLDVPYPNGFTRDRKDHGLQVLPLVESYRGFVFASFNADAGTLDAHLGNGKKVLDRAVEMSPVGEIKLNAGWVKHKFYANWKMLPENDTDGYHVNFVHASFAKVLRSHYDESLLQSEDDMKSETIDWGNGHTELNLAPTYTKEMEWLGYPDASRFPDYVASLEQAHGHERAHEILRAGPPHTVIFPNLFIAEMNVVMFEPRGPNECVQLHTALLLGGVSEALNERILRQSEAAMGPSGFLLADDGIISERQQIALKSGRSWLDISRGDARERHADNGAIIGHVTDETTNRGFWRHYKKVMTR